MEELITCVCIMVFLSSRRCFIDYSSLCVVCACGGPDCDCKQRM